MKNLFLFLMAFLVAHPVSAKIFLDKPVKSYNINMGTHTEFYQGVQVDGSGGMQKTAFAPTLGIGAHLPLTWSGFSFLPEFNWVLPQTNESTHIVKNILMLRTDLAYDIFNWFRVRAGTSIMWLNQHGRGGSTNINNGNTSSRFYYPDENRSSWNNSLDLGVEFMVKDWAARLQTYTYAYFDDQRRQISYTLFLTYYWGR